VGGGGCGGGGGGGGWVWGLTLGRFVGGGGGGAPPAETGLFLLPMTAGIGIGSMFTGQMVTRTGWTAVFPTYGLTAATVGLVAIAFLAPHLTPAQLAWAFCVIALFMGTVMGVVQVTVQAGS